MSDFKGGDRPIEPANGGDHRHAHRQRTLRAAKVVLTDATIVDCTVRDLNEDGARLVFGDAFTLPAEFRVIIVSLSTIAPARLQWQRGLEAGVTFTGPAEPFHTLKP
jgi:hypothetical protein